MTLLDELDQEGESEVLDWLSLLKSLTWAHGEVFARLNTEKSNELLKQSLDKPKNSFRMKALEILIRRKRIDIQEVENILVARLDKITIADGMADVHRMVSGYRHKFTSDQVKKKVLDNCLNGSSDVRFSSAQLAMFLYGLTTSINEPNHEKFCREFKSRDYENRKRAFDNLIEEIYLHENPTKPST